MVDTENKRLQGTLVRVADNVSVFYSAKRYINAALFEEYIGMACIWEAERRLFVTDKASAHSKATIACVFEALNIGYACPPSGQWTPFSALLDDGTWHGKEKVFFLSPSYRLVAEQSRQPPISPRR